MKLGFSLLFITLSFIVQIARSSSTSLYHNIVPALEQQEAECGIHALFNAYCFVTDINHLDKKELKKFRRTCLRLHGPVHKHGIYSDKIFELKEKLIPPCDSARTALLIHEKTKNKKHEFYSYENLLQDLMWFHSDCATKKLSVIFLHTAHYNTFNFYKDSSGTITCEVADSAPYHRRIHAQASIIKETVLQARQIPLLTQPFKPAMQKSPVQATAHKKRKKWIKIAYFNSFSGPSPLQKRPFNATLILW